MQPSELRIAADRSSIEIEWEDGRRDRLTADRLRAACRSSRSLRAQVDGFEAAADAIAIADLRAVGRYAVNIVFSDGHDRGIYPWAYLRDLSAGN
ncbi:MAG: gamma-butyrobetaine hydroxylase-like domain-containing protein [Alphaproteobacteria bacterium]